MLNPKNYVFLQQIFVAKFCSINLPQKNVVTCWVQDTYFSNTATSGIKKFAFFEKLQKNAPLFPSRKGCIKTTDN
jgi:hypothetical protein